MKKTIRFLLLPGIAVIVLLIAVIGIKEDPVDIRENTACSTAACGDHMVFTDHVNGCRLTVPQNLNIDASRAEVCMLLTGENMDIKIFREDFPTEEEIDSSIHYSNYFLENHSLFSSSAHHTERC